MRRTSLPLRQTTILMSTVGGVTTFVAVGTSVGSTFDDVRRALVRTLDTSASLDTAAGHADGPDLLLSGKAAAYPADEDHQLLRDLRGRRTSAEHRDGPTSPTVVETLASQPRHVEVPLHYCTLYITLQEGLAVASIARDVVVEMTPPRDDNAR